MKVSYSKNRRIRIAVLSTLALLFALTLALTPAAQELRPPLAPQTSSTNDFHIYLPTMRTPPPPYALQFDGLDDFASIADKGDFDFDHAFTVEAWVKPLSIPPYDSIEDIGLVLGTKSEPPIPWSTHQSWGLTQEPDYYDKFKSICFDTCCRNNIRYGMCSSLTGAGRWHHFAGTYDEGKLHIYYNGVQDNYPSKTRQLNVAEADFVILGMKEGSFNGLIDEVRIWNVARTPEQIQANWNRSLRGDEPGLVGYWRLDEGSGQAIMDASPRLNDGRLGSTTGPDQNDPVWVVSDAPLQ